jgi:cytochrome b6-f complex iron-sulfur subunit
MTRKEFLQRVGFGAAVAIVPACIGGLASSCEKDGQAVAAPTNVNFTLDVSTGALATNGGFLVSNGIVVARTTTGTFIAVSAACTHQGTNVNYNPSGNNFVCPNHGAQFSSTGVVTQGPAGTNLATYHTQLTGTSLKVYS